MNLAGVFGLERIWGGSRARNVVTAEEPVVRREIVTSGPVYDAVQKLRHALEYPELHPNVEMWIVDDTAIRRKK